MHTQVMVAGLVILMARVAWLLIMEDANGRRRFLGAVRRVTPLWPVLVALLPITTEAATTARLVDLAGPLQPFISMFDDIKPEIIALATILAVVLCAAGGVTHSIHPKLSRTLLGGAAGTAVFGVAGPLTFVPWMLGYLNHPA